MANQEDGISRGFYSGLVDFSGVIKPRGYFRQSLWSDKPMIYIGTYISNRWNNNKLSIDALPSWNYRDNQIIKVVCYTNAFKARLELNGEVVGEEKNYNSDTGIISWDIPYKSGKLEAIGLNNDNKEVSRYTITSSKRPYALKAKTETNLINRDKGVAQIMVEVVDENGIPVMLSDNEITCSISGPGKVLGLEAGNNRDMVDYTDNKQRVFQGKIAIYIQAVGKTVPYKC
ncbi:DUF4982 domain-containing protein [Thalassobellus suaedae]|uniref:DUF4982 domain-containing protein n=1 Tax=Thalassobellus suaedae TaxID=3074124 RepID=A0ABY9XXM5_9FLAO|nr:DUF4982 domain-containing protein [Flavobacteriaceae bacterium HL-DH14]